MSDEADWNEREAGCESGNHDFTMPLSGADSYQCTKCQVLIAGSVVDRLKGKGGPAVKAPDQRPVLLVEKNSEVEDPDGIFRVVKYSGALPVRL